MGNILFSLTIAVLSLQFFTVTYRLNGVNRTLYNIPISIFETSIPLISDNDEFVAYYHREVLNDQLTYYFETSLKKYVNHYTLDFYYFNQEDFSICLGEYCDAIEITLKADVLLNIKYQKAARFYIRSNVNG